MAFVAEESPNLKQAAAVEGRVSDEPRPNFQLFVCPLEWSVARSGALMPTIVHVNKLPGTGAVTRRGGFAPELLRQQASGRIPIPHEAVPGDYVKVYRNKKGRQVCRSAFQVPYQGADGVTLWSHDNDAYERWVALMIRQGIIPRPSAPVLHGLREQHRVARDHLGKSKPTNPAAEEAWREQLDFHLHALEVIDEHLEAARAAGDVTQAQSIRDFLAEAEAALEAALEEPTEPEPEPTEPLKPPAKRGRAKAPATEPGE